MNDKQNLSADLMRIGEWIYRSEDDLANRFLIRDQQLYDELKVKIGKWSLNHWLKLIENRIGGREQAAERALTAAAILAGAVSRA